MAANRAKYRGICVAHLTCYSALLDVDRAKLSRSPVVGNQQVCRWARPRCSPAVPVSFEQSPLEASERCSVRNSLSINSLTSYKAEYTCIYTAQLTCNNTT